MVDQWGIGHRSRLSTRSWARGFLVVATTAVFALPALFLIAGAVHEIGLPPAGGYDWLPNPATGSNFALARDTVPIDAALWTSILVTSVALPLSILVASMAGFAIVTAPPRFSRLLIAANVLALMTPASALWVPRFAIYDRLGLIGTLWPLVLPALMASTPLAVFIFALAYWRIPPSTIDAARVDDVSPIRLWWNIMVPLGGGALVAASLVTFLFHWSSYAEPLLYLTSDHVTTASLTIGQLGALDFAKLPIGLAGAVIFTVPAFAVFAIAQPALFALTRNGTHQ